MYLKTIRGVSARARTSRVSESPQRAWWNHGFRECTGRLSHSAADSCVEAHQLFLFFGGETGQTSWRDLSRPSDQTQNKDGLPDLRLTDVLHAWGFSGQVAAGDLSLAVGVRLPPEFAVLVARMKMLVIGSTPKVRCKIKLFGQFPLAGAGRQDLPCVKDEFSDAPMLDAPSVQQHADAIRRALNLPGVRAQMAQSGCEAACSLALQGLEDLASMVDKDVLARRSSGKAGYQYSAMGMVEAVLLGVDLKSQDRLKTVLQRALLMVCPGLGAAFAQSLEQKKSHVPGKAVLSKAKLRLDAAFMHVCRARNRIDLSAAHALGAEGHEEIDTLFRLAFGGDAVACRYLFIDASPVARQDWLLMEQHCVPSSLLGSVSSLFARCSGVPWVAQQCFATN